MDYLWTPWRYAYVSNAEKISGCIFCELVKLADDKAYIVHRGKHCFIILNAFPYTNGHVMIVPYGHVDEIQKLPGEAAHEMIERHMARRQVSPMLVGRKLDAAAASERFQYLYTEREGNISIA